MVIITREGYTNDPDVNPPPRSIFDPPDVTDEEELSDDGWGNTSTVASSSMGADTLTTKWGDNDTLSTAFTGATKRRQRHKHPSQLNEVELRIQLWDAYRLARIILGKPIKSTSLRGKTILQSIRKVAEMKLELIRLEKELEMAKVYRDQVLDHKRSKKKSSSSDKKKKHQRNHSQDSEATERQPPKSPPKTNYPRSASNQDTSTTTSQSLCEELNMHIADILLPGLEGVKSEDVDHRVDKELWHQTSPIKISTSKSRTTPIVRSNSNKQQNVDSSTIQRRPSVSDDDNNVEQHSEYQDGDDFDDEDEDDVQQDHVPTPVRKTKTMSDHQLLEMYKTRYETLQRTHDQMMKEFQMQLLEMQAHVLEVEEASALEAETARSSGNHDSSNPTIQRPLMADEPGDHVESLISGVAHSEGQHTATSLKNEYSTAPGQPSRGEQPFSQPQRQQPAHSSTTRPRATPKDISNNATVTFKDPSKPSSSKPSKTKPSRADAAFQAVASVARDYDLEEQTPEERHLRTEIAKAATARPEIPKHYQKSSQELPQNSTTAASTVNAGEERKKLQRMIAKLMKKVEDSSEQTRAQFDALQEQLRAHRSANSTSSLIGTDALLGQTPTTSFDYSSNQSSPSRPLDGATQEELQRRLKTAKTLHMLELETFKNKHAQQLVDLSGQLDAYQHQVERQNSELQKWRRKYNHLEEMAVTPDEANEVLEELEALSPHAPPEEHERVQAKAVQVLQRMAQLHSRQQKEQKAMAKTKLAALAKQAETLEQLEDLKLQYELLEEDTKIPPEEWQQRLSQQRKAFEKEMRDIFRRQEKRMVEIERLEVQLTELAFVAVEVEDLEVDFKVNHEIYAEELVKARRQLATTAPAIRSLQNQVKQVLISQRKALQDLDHSWTKGTEIEELRGRLRDISSPSTSPRASNDELLQRKDAELREAKAQLLASQRRVLELEAAMLKLRSDSTVSTAQLSDD